jgi:hypothetical protein
MSPCLRVSEMPHDEQNTRLLRFRECSLSDISD